MGTKPGTVTDRLPSELAGCGGDVGGSLRRLLVALSAGHLGGGWQGQLFPQPSYFLGGEGGNSGPAEKKRRGRTRKGFPGAMEPRIAGSVSRATDTQGSPRGTGLVTAGITPQLFFPGPILITYTRATALYRHHCLFIYFYFFLF